MTTSTRAHLARPSDGRHALKGNSARVPSALVISAVVLFLGSIALLTVLMTLGPPVMDPQGPIWSISARSSAATHATVYRTGLLLGALSVAAGLAAVGRGWRPSGKLMLGVGTAVAVLFVFLPPAGSGDVLDYAAYGRIAALGHNPYVMPPSQLYAIHDPVGLFTPAFWRGSTTIYGPVATAFQWAAAILGGASMARIVFWIKLGFGIAFVVTAVGLRQLAGQDSARQARVCLLWAVNPLMLFWMVGSAHVDVLLAMLAVLALILIRSNPGIIAGGVTGVLIGTAMAIKFPFALAALGMAWAVRRSPRTIVAGLLGAAAVITPGYLLPGVMNTAILSGRLSVATGFIAHVPVAVRSRPALFGSGVLVATLALAFLLLLRLPPAHAAMPAVRPALALALAWLAVCPIQAPWYDALIFPLLVLMPPSWLDYLLIARCLLLSETELVGAQPRLSFAVSRFSNLGVLLTFGALIVMCLWRARRVARPDGDEAAAVKVA